MAGIVYLTDPDGGAVILPSAGAGKILTDNGANPPSFQSFAGTATLTPDYQTNITGTTITLPYTPSQMVGVYKNGIELAIGTDVTLSGSILTFTTTLSSDNIFSMGLVGGVLSGTAGGDLSGTYPNPTVGIAGKNNFLVNGGFEIWQRGVGPFTLNSAYTADRWQMVIVGSDTVSISKDTVNSAPGSTACAAVTYTKVTGSSSLEQKLEDFKQLGGNTVSVSCLIKCSTPNAVHVQLNDSSGSTSSAEHPGDGLFHALTVTRSIPASITSFRGVLIVFDASCTAYIDNTMLVISNSPVSYIPLNLVEEWERCQRYYELFVTGTNIYLTGQGGSTSQAFFPYRWRVLKAVTPSVTVSNATSFNCTNAGGSNIACTALSPTNLNLDGCQLTATTAVGGGLASAAATLLTEIGTGQIAVEANP